MKKHYLLLWLLALSAFSGSAGSIQAEDWTRVTLCLPREHRAHGVWYPHGLLHGSLAAHLPRPFDGDRPYDVIRHGNSNL